jgi:hypothetical protein
MPGFSAKRFGALSTISLALWLGLAAAASAQMHGTISGITGGSGGDYSPGGGDWAGWSSGSTPLPPSREEVAQAKAWARDAGIGCRIGTVIRLATVIRVSVIQPTGTKVASRPSPVYEVSCLGGFGFAVQAPDGKASAVPCPALKPWTHKEKTPRPACALWQDNQQIPPLQKLVSGLGSPCAVAAVKWRGVDQAKEDLFELACTSPSPGYILAVARADGKAALIGCLNPQLDFKCDLTSAEQQKAWLGKLIDRSGRTCGQATTRFAAATSESEIFEARCSSGDGFMVEADLGGRYKRAIDCKDAGAIGGGCVLK